MKINFKEALSRGIRYHDEVGRNYPAMQSVINRRPMRHGDTAYEVVVRPFAGSPTETINSDMTVVRNGAGEWLLGESIYPLTLDKEDGYTEGSPVTCTHVKAQTTLTDLPGTGKWHTAVFFKGWMAFRNGCVVWTTDGTNFFYTTVGPSTGCEMRGRMFYGDLTNFFQEVNKYGYFTDWLQGLTLYTPGNLAMEDFPSNMVYMCSINGHDIRWFAQPYLMIDSQLSFTDYETGVTNSRWLTSGTWATATPSGIYTAKITGSAETTSIQLHGLGAGLPFFSGQAHRLEVYAEVSAGQLAVSSIAGDHKYFIGPDIIDETGVYVYHFQTISSQSPDIDFAPDSTFTGSLSVVAWKTSGANENLDDTKQRGLGELNNQFLNFGGMNDSGFYHMSWPGTVYKMLPMRDHVIIYGDNGITALSKSGGAIMAVSDLMKCGIASREAVGGNLDAHLFMTSEGELVRLDNSLQMTVIGGRELFSLNEDTTLNEILITFDETWKDFYITDVTNSRYFIHTESGLGEIYQPVFEMIPLGKQGSLLDGLTSDRVGLAGTLSASSAKWVTDIIDMESGEHKYLKNVRVLIDNPDNQNSVTVRVYYRNTMHGGFHTLSQGVADEMGIVNVGKSVVQFYIEIDAEDKDVRLHDIQVEFSDLPARHSTSNNYGAV